MAMNPNDYDIIPPTDDEQRKNARLRIWERFEQAFFVGVLIVLIGLTLTLLINHYAESQSPSLWEAEYEKELDAVLALESVETEETGPPPSVAMATVVESEEPALMIPPINEAFDVDTSWIEESIDVDLGLRAPSEVEDPLLDVPVMDAIGDSTIAEPLPLMGGALALPQRIWVIRGGGISEDLNSVYRRSYIVWGLGNGPGTND